MRRSSRRCRALACCLLLGSLWSLSGCSLLADEVGWLDRAAPGSLRAPDAPVAGTTERP